MHRTQRTAKPNPPRRGVLPAPSLTLHVRTRKVRLTPRQIQVLVLLVEGKTMKEAAYALKINHKTVRTHVRRAQRKLQAKTRDQMMAMAGASGLYRDDGNFREAL